MIRWESEEAWKNWETSEEHLAGHRAGRGKPKPDHIINASRSLLCEIIEIGLSTVLIYKQRIHVVEANMYPLFINGDVNDRKSFIH